MRFILFNILLFSVLNLLSQDLFSYWDSGRFYMNKDSNRIALFYFKKAESLALAKNDFYYYKLIATDLSKVYLKNNNPKKALEYLEKISRILEQKSPKDQIFILSQMGNIEKKFYDYEQALFYYKKALAIATKLQNYTQKKNLLLKIAYLYKQMDDFDNFVIYLNNAYAISDSLKKNKVSNPDSFYIDNLIRFEKIKNEFSQESLQTLNFKLYQQKLRYFQAKKTSELLGLQVNRLQKQIDLQKKIKSAQRSVIIITFIFLIIMAILLAILYNTLKDKQKALNELKILYKKIDEQKKELEKKNMQITENIRYAKQLQSALFPSLSLLKKIFKDIFILNLPRDIISGDFYWYNKVDDYHFFIEADCTGHGVPGAIMATMGTLILNQIIISDRITNLNDIILKINEFLIKNLHSNNKNAPNDGMDLSVVRFDTKNKKVSLMVVNQFLIYTTKNKTELIEGNLFSIGAYTNIGFKPKLKTIELEINEPTNFYLFSDGYIDQFNFEHKKFLLKRFLDLVDKIKNQNFRTQEKIFYESFLKWKGNMRQMDDVLVIGIKL